MSNKDKEMKNMNDSFENLLDGIGDRMLPPPELEKAVIAGSYYRGRADAGMHVRKITGAIVAYAVGVMLLLGTLMLLPRLFDEYTPMSSQTTQTEEEDSPNPTADFAYEIDWDGTLIITQYEGTDSNVIIPEKIDYMPVATIGERAFADNDTITSVTLHTGIRVISAEAFSNCDNLHTVVLAEGLEEICANAFSDCQSLSNISLPSSLTQIGAKAFAHCKSLKHIKIPSQCFRSIDGSYSRCDNAVSVFLFSGLETAELEEGVEFITFGMFSCTNLREVILPNTIKVISERAFSQCESLETIIYNGSNDLWEIIEKGEYWDDQTPEYELEFLISPHEHQYTTKSTDGNPCTTDITTVYTCIHCGYTYSETVPSKGHTFADGLCADCGYKCDHQFFNELVSSTPYHCIFGQSITFYCQYCKCNFVQEVEGAGVHFFEGNECTVCFMWCEHHYVNGVCESCGTPHTHEYETIVSDNNICTEGIVTTTSCKSCSASYTETTPAVGHQFENNRCTVCNIQGAPIPVSPPDITEGSFSLLPEEMHQFYRNPAHYREYYCIDPTSTPVYYNVYTYFAGYTVTDIRLPVCQAKKGGVFTVRVVETKNGYNQDVIATYELVADRDMEMEWVLFSGLSINVPEGCTLTFGWMSDTICILRPTEGFINGYCYWNDYRGSCGLDPLIMDVYGKKN